MYHKHQLPLPTASRAIAEILLVWAIVIGLLWTLWLNPNFLSWERVIWGVPLISTTALFIVLPLMVLKLTGRDLGQYGIILGELRYSVETGFTALAVLGPISGTMFPFLIFMGWTPTDWMGGLLLALGYGVAIPLTAYAIRSTPMVSIHATPTSHLIIFFLFLGVAAVIAAVAHSSSDIVTRVIFYLFFVGLGEELLFRGYIQSHLNHALGKTFSFMGVKYGLGMFIAALLFGIAHLLSPINPGHWGWGLWTFICGLAFGYIREKNGGFVASAIVHGVLLSVPVLISGYLM